MTLPFDYIVITSDEPMGNMYHTQLLFAEFLAKHNQVIFIDPPEPWRPNNLFRNKKAAVSKGKLTVISYWNRFPSFLNVFNWVNERLNESRLISLFQKGSSPKVLIWHFDSYRSVLNGPDLRKQFHVTRIYHVIDPYFRNPVDPILRDLADLIAITSPRLVSHYSSHAQKTMTLPQALDLNEHSEFLKGPLPDKFETETPYVVLIGTFSIDIDYEWLSKFVISNPTRLVLIGKVVPNKNNIQKFQSLSSLKGVEYLGEMAPREFYPILKKAKAGLIVYNERRRNAVFSPLKVLNYLVAGLPVITNADCEIPSLVNESIFFTSDLEQFISTLQSADHLGVNKEKTNSYLHSVSIEKSITAILQRLTSNLNKT